MSQLVDLLSKGELELESIVMYFANEFNVPLTDDREALLISLVLTMSDELNIPIPYGKNPVAEFVQLVTEGCG